MKLFLIYFLGLFAALSNAFEKDNLLYRTSLEFRKGFWTDGTKPIEQLQCIDDKISDNFCYDYSIKHATCRNRGRTSKGISWKCNAAMPSNIKFNNLKVNCERYPGSFNDEIVIKNSCALIYSLKKTSGNSNIGGIVLAVVLAVVFLSLIGYCCVRCSESAYTDHVYTGQPTVVHTTTRPAVYTVPVAPAIVPVPTYFPPNHHHTHHHTSIGFSNTTYRDGYNNSHIDSGFANTTYRDGYNDSHIDSGFGNTDFRGGNDTYVDSGFGNTDFRGGNDNGGGFSDTYNDTSYGDTSFR